MAMNNEATHVEDTQHAFLVAWGRFAQQIGLVQGIQAVPLHQKRYTIRRRPKSWSSWSRP